MTYGDRTQGYYAPNTTIPNPWYHPTYPQPIYYPFPAETRWKCPDCGGWVINTVQVHFCTNRYTTTSPTFIINQSDNTTEVEGKAGKSTSVKH